MMQAVEASLRRLKTDYIDLYWLHVWDQMTPVEEVMRGFDDLVQQGKVLYVGVSDAPAWWISKANTIAAFRGWTPFVGLQIEYSLIERTVERELIPVAKDLGLTVTAWSPLAGGVLTGKYASGNAEDARYSSEMMQNLIPDKDRTARVLDALQSVSKQTGRSKAQIALAWLRYRPVPVIPIIGARKISQLQDNIASLEVSLTPEQAAVLDEASKIDLGFPHEFYAHEMVRTFVYGGLRDRILA
jgi:aryl-alcohol dehydrogenase-like predicted oxidoreductase